MNIKNILDDSEPIKDMIRFIAQECKIDPDRITMSVTFFDPADFIPWKDIYLDGKETGVSWSPEMKQDAGMIDLSWGQEFEARYVKKIADAFKLYLQWNIKGKVESDDVNEFIKEKMGVI